MVWRAVRPVPADYSLFVHLLDEGGSLVAQDDGFPSGGNYPTSAWRAGELVEDRRRLPVADARAGRRLSISLGWYRLESGERLPVTGPTTGENSLRIGPFPLGR